MKYKLMLFVLSSCIFSLQLHSQDESWKVYDDSQTAIINISMDNSDLQFMYNNVESDSVHPCTIHFTNAEVNDTVDNVGIRLRGNTSRNVAKKSFKISFNIFSKGEDFYSLEKLNLNGEANDPNKLRSKLCWDLYKDMGMISSRASHAEVYINDQYYGVYTSVEHIDDEFLNKNFEDDSGNLWKCLHPANLSYFGSDPDLYKAEESDRRIYDLKTNKLEDDYSELAHFIDVINNVPDSLFYDSLLVIINIEELLKNYAFDILAGSWDDYWFGWNNFYLYFNPDENRIRLIPYDYDNTFGVDFGTYDDWATKDIYNWVNVDAQPSILSERILNNNKLRNLFTHFLEYYANNVFKLSLWESRADSVKEQITESIKTDPYLYWWGFSVLDFHQAYDSTGYYFHESLKLRRSLKEFVNVRVNSTNGQIDYIESNPIIYKTSINKNILFDQDSILVKASIFSPIGISTAEVILESDGTVIDTIPMIFDPKFGDNEISEADRWRVKFLPDGNWELADLKIIAVDNNGNKSIYQNIDLHIKRVLKKSTHLLINEIMASNTNSIMDAMGENDDWIELLNSNDAEVDIGNLYVTDDKRNLTKWRIPDNTIIQPNSYIIFWCDEETDQGNYHTNFKLKSSGEFLALVDKDGFTILDSLHYPSIQTDISYGRNLTIDSSWYYFVLPTPGHSNYIEPKQISQNVLLNEVMSLNISVLQDENGDFDDWIEIYNSTDSVINLSNKYLTDSKNFLGKWQFPNNSSIDPNEFLIIWCDNDSSNNEIHSNFNLSSDGEFLAIVDSDGVSFIDSVHFPEISSDYSYSRNGDNFSIWEITETPTPGLGNIITGSSDFIPEEFNNSVSAYPNPFNPSTKIVYELSESMHVDLRIFNILGQIVWSSPKIKRKSGKYEFVWKGKNNLGNDLPSGIYFLNFVGDSYFSTVKLMLIR